MNFIIGTLLNLCPIGKVKPIQTGGHMIKATRSSKIFQDAHVSEPRQSSYGGKTIFRLFVKALGNILTCRYR